MSARVAYKVRTSVELSQSDLVRRSSTEGHDQDIFALPFDEFGDLPSEHS
jgi:hypothetical protein